MKRLFTFVVGMLLISSAAFAQEKYTNVTTNGNVEGDDLSCFWAVETRNAGDTEKTIGEPLVVEDEKKAGNHCFKVRVRNGEQGATDRYDSQFFVISNGASGEITEGKDVRITMRIRSDKNTHIGTQAHSAPQSFLDYNTFGESDITTEWKKYTFERKNLPSGANGMTTIAFDLYNSNLSEETNVYFDDIKMEVRDHQEDSGSEFSGWFNFMRHGINSADNFVYSNGTYTNFTGRDGAINEFLPARIVNDPLDGLPALNVTSICWNATYDKETKTEILDEEGNPVLDEEGNPTYDVTVETLNCYIKENGDTLKTQNGDIGIDDWQTQFFVATPHAYKSGEKFKFAFQVRADKPAQIQSQIHKGPGDYLWYEFLGNFDVTEDWQTFEFEQEIGSSQAGGYTVAFNCNVLKTEVNNYYFRILEIAANAGDVTDDERTLQKVNIALPVPAPDKEANIKVDMAPLMEVLEVNDLVTFLNENSMCATVKTPEGEGDDIEIVESLMSGLQATTGIFLDDMGSVIDSEDGINIYFPEEEISGTEATLNIGNFSGKAFEVGNTVDTKICFEKRFDEDPDIKGWLYGLDITLMDPEAYEKHAGISEVVVKKMGNNAIYDLSGRKVSKPTKGLYIQDGKKVIK